MITIEEMARQLSANAAALRALLQTVSEEQALWKPDPQTWSLKEVMEHFYNEERLDFRKHLQEMFSNPPQAWEPFREENFVRMAGFQEVLAAFLAEREASLAYLASLDAPDWEITTQAPWGPIRAGDVFVSWVEHDFLHIRQLNELLYAWNEQQAAPYSVEYAGGW